MNDTTSTETDTAEKPRPVTFGPEISRFNKHIDAIGDVLIGLVMAVQEISKTTKQELSAFESENCDVSETEKERTVKVPNNRFKAWKTLSRRHEHFELSRTLLPRSLFMALIAQYDAYLGRLLKVIFTRKPEILNSSDKKISFEDLSKFESIGAAKEYILEKEVEAILRCSHADQFKWMERTFNLPLTKELKAWPIFVEATERRNLFAHVDGVVSSQYLLVCKANKCKIEDGATEGFRLDVPQSYFGDAHRCIFEVGTKLGHVLWRKLFPAERDAADTNLINITYDLIDHRKYDLAIRLLDFSCSEIKKYSNEANQLAMVVNWAQAYKWKGNEEKCAEIMRGVDWSAKGDQFRLADFVLADKWDDAVRVMKQIGKDGCVEQTCYRDWPLFRKFRKQEQFLEMYRQIFGEDFGEKSEVRQKALVEASESPSSDLPPLGAELDDL